MRLHVGRFPYAAKYFAAGRMSKAPSSPQSKQEVAKDLLGREYMSSHPLLFHPDILLYDMNYNALYYQLGVNGIDIHEWLEHCCAASASHYKAPISIECHRLYLWATSLNPRKPCTESIIDEGSETHIMVVVEDSMQSSWYQHHCLLFWRCFAGCT